MGSTLHFLESQNTACSEADRGPLHSEEEVCSIASRESPVIVESVALIFKGLN